MSKYSDVVAILEWADKRNKQIPTSETKRRGNRRYREDDPFENVLKMKRFVDEYNKFMSDQEKINKKEDKKEEKKEDKKWWDKLNIMQKMTVLTITVPPVMMFQILLTLEFAKAVKVLF